MYGNLNTPESKAAFFFEFFLLKKPVICKICRIIRGILITKKYHRNEWNKGERSMIMYKKKKKNYEQFK